MAETRPSWTLAHRFGAAMLVLIFAVGLLAPWIVPYSPSEQLDARGGQLQPPGTKLWAVQTRNRWYLVEDFERTGEGLRFAYFGGERYLASSEVLNLTADGVGDSRVFLFGSDKFGRDVLSRVIYGARISLFIGLTSVLLAVSIGGTVGALAGLLGGWIDSLLMRIVDGLLSFPWFFLLIGMMAVFPLGPLTLILVLGSTTWMSISRIVRGEILSLREQDFVVAARGFGGGPLYILRRHLLPNVFGPVLVAATLQIGPLILAEAALSFLGFGIAPPTPSWGEMIATGRYQLSTAWWIATFPGLALVATVVAINLVGDGLRVWFNPAGKEA